MKIGEVARRVGLAASAIRYYEKAGLLPRAPRTSRRREYDTAILGRLAIIQLAREAGFTIREIRLFLSGFAPSTKPSRRWQTMARIKLREIDAAIARSRAMKRVIEDSFRCECPNIEDCERIVAGHRSCRDDARSASRLAKRC
jgi:DNA-binding transcriptional MerR regulator